MGFSDRIRHWGMQDSSHGMHLWMQDFSYGHCVGLEAGLFLWPLDRSGGRTILMVTGQVWRQDFSYGHCAGLEARLFLWPLCRSGGRTFLMITARSGSKIFLMATV